MVNTDVVANKVDIQGVRQEIAYRLEGVTQEIESTCKDCGRQPSDIQVVAVTKGQSLDAIAAAHQVGLVDIGESYFQEARAKQDSVEAPQRIRWHFIGHLQRNKAALAACRFVLIQSVDSLRLAQALSEKAQESGRIQDILVQVRLGAEATKYGIEPDNCQWLCDQVRQLSGLRLRGLMGITSCPHSGRSSARSEFNRIRALFEELDTPSRCILSIGMSADYADAIREGSTMLRLGTALFGPRN